MLDGVKDRKFLPDRPLPASDWNHAVESLGGYGIQLKTAAKPATRAEAAVVLTTAVQTALGTAISTTVGTIAQTSGTLTANVQVPITISTAYQATNTWLAWMNTAGASGTGSRVILEFVWGK